MATATIDANTTWEELGFEEARLHRNLDALRRCDVELTVRLERAGIHPGLGIAGEAARLTRTTGRVTRRVEESPREIDVPSPTPTTLLLGIGTGERVDAMLHALAPKAVLFAHESDAGLLTLALARYDWCEEISSGRLRLLLGADLHTSGLPDDLDVVVHPLLAADVARTANRVARTRSAAPPAGRAAVLRGELLQEEIADALESADRDVMILERETTSLDGLAAELARLDAPLAASINFEPELAEICGRLGIDYAAWEIDPTASSLPRASRRAAEYSHVFTWRQRRVAEFAAAGWRQAEHLPIGADPARRLSSEEDRDDALVFVGSCMLSQGRRHDVALRRAAAADRSRAAEWNAFLTALDALERDLVRDPCRADVPETLEAELATRGLPLFVPVAGEMADVRVLAGERLASTKRIAVARALEDCGLRVHGETDWSSVLSAGVYGGPAGHGEELTRLLGTSAISLDLNRVYQPDIVTLRVFEVGACGGFVLTEESDALHDLFACDEIATWSSTIELREAIAHYRANPDERDEMAARLHARVLREHTVRHRIAHMLAVIDGRARARADRRA